MPYQTFWNYFTTMARKARLTVPGAVHHIMARGIEGRDIFCDDEDRSFFLSLLSEGISRNRYRCYAWVLMNNHYHILIRVNEQPLSGLMRRLNSRYAIRYRKKYKGRGYLFQDRYKSIVTQDQGYIEQLVRYIHLNPIRAGVCRNMEELDEYPWSGHAVLLKRKVCRFQDTADILRRFACKGKSEVEEYREYIAEGIATEEQGDLLESLRKSNTGAVDRKEYRCWVIGDREFARKAIESDKLNRVQLSAYIKKGITVERVIKEVAQQMGFQEEDVLRRGRQNSRSVLRKVVAALSHRRFGIPVTEIARYYGVEGSSVSRMLDHGESYVKKLKIKVKL